MADAVLSAEKPLVVSAPPHVSDTMSSRAIMLWVIGAASPAAVWAVVTMGVPAAATLLFCIVGALGTEYAWNALAKREQTVLDGSAMVTGLLLALSMPTRTPWWIALTAGAVAISLGKMLFGGLGLNLFNPALVGRAVTLVSWAGVMAAVTNHGWFRTLSLPAVKGFDAVSGATRLALASADRAASGAYGFDMQAQYSPLLLRNLEGSLGEVSGALLIAGGLVLIAKGIVDWRIPLGYVGAMGLLSWAFGSDPLFNVLAGGVLLGAFFMATDYVTSPIDKRARLAFGVGCGVFNAVGRFYGSMPEATTFAILFMNGMAPLLDRLLQPRTFGWVKGDG